MILDRIEQADLYAKLNPPFAQAFAFLQQKGLNELADGRHDINGDDIYALVVKGTRQSRGEAKLEMHRKYIDVQYVVSGCDNMGWKNHKLCENSEGDYDAEIDTELFSDAPSAWITVCPGDFVIFFPEDAHAPGVGDGAFHKVVVKVAV
ncbi:MAG: DUF386 family protein [Actinobacteria bacterium]|nr:DUF386 family protein [Actinomycetota bacterium]